MREVILAQREHLPAVAELEKATFFEPWSEKSLELFLTDGAFCVACVDSEVLFSYCTVTCVLDEAQIINVATDSEHRGRGLAREVLEFVFDECKKRNITSISLEVRESNAPAIALYNSLGFSMAGVRKNFYTNPRENALVMIKNLD
ncbi:MAG: ribosomal protein S18-alanine N-acetyltransferase [Clostridia bacterium]|nr:ribosomal protein S18-alanine N-acetyltransferase [Clostridia bacterium]